MRWLCALLLTAAAAAAPAAASPLSDPSLGRAVFAGTTESHPSSFHLNSAPLGWGTPGWHFSVSGMGTLDQLSIDRRLVDPASGNLLDGPSVSTNTTSLGGAMSVWYVAESPFSVGFSTAIRPAEVFPARDDLRYHTTGGSHQQMPYGAIHLSIRVNSIFSIGASFAFIDNHLKIAYMRDTALAGGRPGIASDCNGSPCGLENPQAQELVEVDVSPELLAFDQDNYEASFGFAFRYKGWRVGGAYRLPAGGLSSLTLAGNATITRANIAPDDQRAIVEGNATVVYTPPQAISIGARRQQILPGLDAVVGGRWELLSSLSHYNVHLFDRELPADYPEWQPRPRGFNDVIAVWAGVEQHDFGNQRILLGGRLGFESKAVDPERMSPMQVNGNVLTADLGAAIRINNNWRLELNYGLGYYPTVDVTDSAYDPIDTLDCVDSGLDHSLPACQTVRDGYGIGTAAGSYRRWSHYGRLALRYDFL